MKKYLLILILITACSEQKKNIKPTVVENKEVVSKVEIKKKIDSTTTKQKNYLDLKQIADTTFVRLADYNQDFFYDMRYATDNNFLKAKVYDCAECYTRSKTAQQLIKANEAFMQKGFHIKFYDCYRPLDVQKKMWKIVPNAMYVANPAKGSIHNKGGAVDITLVDSLGNELPMGTDFDFFGQQAHHSYKELPESILKNREYLKSTMEKYGFHAIESEWWHYNLAVMTGVKVANFNWNCN